MEKSTKVRIISPNNSNSMLRTIIIIVSSMVIGMIIGLFTTQSYTYHGPNAIQQSKKIYHHTDSSKCYQFRIDPKSVSKICSKTFKINL